MLWWWDELKKDEKGSTAMNEYKIYDQYSEKASKFITKLECKRTNMVVLFRPQWKNRK